MCPKSSVHCLGGVPWRKYIRKYAEGRKQTKISVKINGKTH